MKINVDLKLNNTVKLLYQLKDDLLYFNNSKREMRLYILTKTLKHEIFKLIYNKIRYSSYARIHEKLIRDIYIFNIFIKFYEYLRYCLYYQLHQISRYSLYKSLQLIYTLSRLFYTIIIDFILTLLKINTEFNSYISIIKKFNKIITLIADSSS